MESVCWEEGWGRGDWGHRWQSKAYWCPSPGIHGAWCQISFAGGTSISPVPCHYARQHSGFYYTCKTPLWQQPVSKHYQMSLWEQNCYRWELLTSSLSVFFLTFCCFWDRASWIPGWTWTYYVLEADLGFLTFQVRIIGICQDYKLGFVCFDMMSMYKGVVKT